MSTNKQALRKELSNPAIGTNAHLRKLAMALLDELEAAEKRIAELEAREVKLPKKNIGWDGDWDYCRNNAIEECSKAIRAAGITVKGE